jgi:hypothetical protein
MEEFSESAEYHKRGLLMVCIVSQSRNSRILQSITKDDFSLSAEYQNDCRPPKICYVSEGWYLLSLLSVTEKGRSTDNRRFSQNLQSIRWWQLFAMQSLTRKEFTRNLQSIRKGSDYELLRITQGNVYTRMCDV